MRLRNDIYSPCATPAVANKSTSAFTLDGRVFVRSRDSSREVTPGNPNPDVLRFIVRVSILISSRKNHGDSDARARATQMRASPCTNLQDATAWKLTVKYITRYRKERRASGESARATMNAPFFARLFHISYVGGNLDGVLSARLPSLSSLARTTFLSRLGSA